MKEPSDSFINKTMDREDLDNECASSVINELNDLIVRLRSNGIGISSWLGNLTMSASVKRKSNANRGFDYTPLPGVADDSMFPWFLFWEIAWVITNNDFMKGDMVLDLGGSSSLFSYFLADKGCSVTTIDKDRALVENANQAAVTMGWTLENYEMDMREMTLDEKFDHVTSICVYEHIPLEERISINRHIRELLVENGRFSITFDYRNPSRKVGISSPGDVWKQFVEPSGLKVRGNAEFYDNQKNYLVHLFHYNNPVWKIKYVLRGDLPLKEFLETRSSNEYTFGALFLEKQP